MQTLLIAGAVLAVVVAAVLVIVTVVLPQSTTATAEATAAASAQEPAAAPEPRVPDSPPTRQAVLVSTAFTLSDPALFVQSSGTIAVGQLEVKPGADGSVVNPLLTVESVQSAPAGFIGTFATVTTGGFPKQLPGSAAMVTPLTLTLGGTFLQGTYVVRIRVGNFPGMSAATQVQAATVDVTVTASPVYQACGTAAGPIYTCPSIPGVCYDSGSNTMVTSYPPTQGATPTKTVDGTSYYYRSSGYLLTCGIPPRPKQPAA